jgi:diguanylate cyclase (GGDEF)-like protein
LAALPQGKGPGSANAPPHRPFLPTAARPSPLHAQDGQARDSDLIARFAQEVAACHDAAALVNGLRLRIAELVEGATTNLFLTEDDPSGLSPFDGANAPDRAGTGASEAGSAARFCAERRRSVVAVSARDGRHRLCLPLIVADRLFGVVVVGARQGFCQREQGLLKALCATLAIPLVRAGDLEIGRLLRETVERSGEATSLYDARGTLLFSNPAYHRIFSHYPPPDRLRGMTHEQLYRLDLAAGIIDDPLARAEPALYLAERMRVFQAMQGEIQEFQKLGDQTYLYQRLRLPSGETLSRRTDVTDIKTVEQHFKATKLRLEDIAYVDAITGLPNRIAFRDRVEAALQSIRGEPGESFAILFLNLDRFKGMNNVLGDVAGDALLAAVGRRLRDALPPADIVARLGGDEFAILRCGCAGGDEIGCAAKDALAAFVAPFVIDGRRLAVNASLGGVVAPADGTSVDGLLQNAGLAVRRAKAAGGGCYRNFEPAMEAALLDRQRLSLDLREAIALGQLDLHYQPIVDMQSRIVCGVEALLRWHHPERGSISPAVFIPIAEEDGFIVLLGEWVLRRACSDAVAWPEFIKIAVNLSSRQFVGADLVGSVVAIAANTGFDLGRLELEITETVLLHDDPPTLAALHKLRSLGVRIALDDFGTGFSSLSTLMRFPFTKIKIDRSFVTGIVDRANSFAIVHSVADLARRLGMVTTAEGVETAEQMACLGEIGCTQVQGYLIARPQPLGEALSWLDAGGAVSAIVTDRLALGTSLASAGEAALSG